MAAAVAPQQDSVLATAPAVAPDHDNISVIATELSVNVLIAVREKERVSAARAQAARVAAYAYVAHLLATS